MPRRVFETEIGPLRGSSAHPSRLDAVKVEGFASRESRDFVHDPVITRIDRYPRHTKSCSKLDGVDLSGTFFGAELSTPVEL